jgi:hypothetical protein
MVADDCMLRPQLADGIPIEELEILHRVAATID